MEEERRNAGGPPSQQLFPIPIPPASRHETAVAASTPFLTLISAQEEASGTKAASRALACCFSFSASQQAESEQESRATSKQVTPYNNNNNNEKKKKNKKRQKHQLKQKKKAKKKRRKEEEHGEGHAIRSVRRLFKAVQRRIAEEEAKEREEEEPQGRFSPLTVVVQGRIVEGEPENVATTDAEYEGMEEGERGMKTLPFLGKGEERFRMKDGDIILAHSSSASSYSFEGESKRGGEPEEELFLPNDREIRVKGKLEVRLVQQQEFWAEEREANKRPFGGSSTKKVPIAVVHVQSWTPVKS
ncbi:hypothetical protein QOT17_010371 [Balamuthia mandrillaris]